MTTDEKLAAILAAVQTDPGNRGLARDPHDNLFTACPGDFAAACRSIAEHPEPAIDVVHRVLHPDGDTARLRDGRPARRRCSSLGHSSRSASRSASRPSGRVNRR